MSHVKASADSNPDQSLWASRPGYKPILLLAALIVFVGLYILPPPQSMVSLVGTEKPAGYKLPADCQSITDAVNKKLSPEAFKEAKRAADAAHGGAEAQKSGEEGAHKEKGLMKPEQTAQMLKIMLLIFFVCVFLWATEALSLGATDLLVAVLLYLFAILPINDISKAYMSDAVFFIFGILVVAVGVAKTGLDKRIGLIILSRIKSAKAFAFIFMPTIAVCASFLSEHALVALLIPVLMGVYKVTCRMYGVEKDRALAVFLLLGICFAANHGGPGSPAAGGRNAIMAGYLMDFGKGISFLEWMKYGMPFVPVCGVMIGAYMYIACKARFKVKDINPAEVVKAEAARMPRFGGKEAIMAVILVCLVAAWIILGEHAGLGGPTMYAVIALFLARIITWDDIQEGVALDVVGLYAAATAMGAGLKFTGAGLWLANTFVDYLPKALAQGDMLAIGVSVLTGAMTNFMSDGATVAALGPIVLPMSALAGVHVWKLGLACAFSSSFANFLVVGTPNNAIAFGMGKDPETGERLLSVFDFVKYGLPVTIIAWLVLWFWSILGYWRFLDWPVLS
ncbi:NadC1 [uncultured Desulfatiglans sp.]|uniref:NadC1 n=1 Tax=Uncultured Desulfatiglans sp. TaxID=1748965 RepID=A0A653A5J6_UNCDX|nr:NadC1 [uncultured Desulfatiglans sp.]